MVPEILTSALSPQLALVRLALVRHKPHLPTGSKLIFSQMPPPRSVLAQTSSGFTCTSTHSRSALIIADIHKNRNWTGKLLTGLCPPNNLILVFLSLQGVEGNAKAKAKSGRKS